ncbi:MAG: hypothetical protein AB1640_04105 [bacterium]
MALFHKQGEPDNVDLMFFTDQGQDTLYIYDLTGTSIPTGLENPFPITNLTIGSSFLQSPAALALGELDDRVVLFVLNDNGPGSSVRRLSVDLSTWMPESPETIATSTEPSRRLSDIAIFADADALFVSKRVEEGAGGVFGWVYRIPDASSRGTALDLNSAAALVEIAQNATGLALGFTNTTGTVADLLLLQEGSGVEQVLQFSTVGALQSAFTPDPSFQFPRAIEYDCTTRRILVTDVPLNDDVDRALLEALPFG